MRVQGTEPKPASKFILTYKVFVLFCFFSSNLILTDLCDDRHKCQYTYNLLRKKEDIQGAY